MELTLSQAFRCLANPDDETPYRPLEKILVAAGFCPSCACDGHRTRLRKWQPGNFYEYAGRECRECEEFYPCGPQPSYEPDPWMGDADPGL